MTNLMPLYAQQARQTPAVESVEQRVDEPSQRIVATAPAVTEIVTITPIQSRTDLLAAPGQEWGWEQVRDYVVAQIVERFGEFPRDARREHSIFTRFVREHGADAQAIARHAFEVCGGWWADAPISVNRFCKASDPFFAVPIKQRLAGSA